MPRAGIDFHPGHLRADAAPARAKAFVLLIAAIIAALVFVRGPLGFVLVGIAALLEVAETFVWLRYSRRRRIQVGAETLLGAEAVVTEPCRPLGLVRLRGELWQARCDAGADPGRRVRVVGRRDLVLVVEPVGDGK